MLVGVEGDRFTVAAKIGLQGLEILALLTVMLSSNHCKTTKVLPEAVGAETESQL
jgi:hypothetical protein